jgi:hypothetical protein
MDRDPHAGRRRAAVGGGGGGGAPAAPAPQCVDDPCTAAMQQQRLVTTLACDELVAAESIPGADHACVADADCEVVTTMCYAAAVSKTAAPRYRAALDRHWGTCIGPGAGACPPRGGTGACVDHRCTLR